jgi:pyruvate carboxylase
VVGDLALALVGANADPAQFEADPTRFDIPDSVIGFLNGDLGDPPGGWPEPFRTKALEGRTRKPAVSDLAPQDEADLVATPRRTLNRLLFPGPTRDFETSRETYSDLSVLGTGEFLHGLAVGAEHEVDLEPGKRLLLGVQSISDADERGLRTVMCTVNGQLRPVRVRDESVRVDVRQAERADPAVAGQVAAPFSGVISLSVTEGDTVEVGDPVATIEAMKMEAAITSPVAGTVQRLAIGSQQQVEGGDLLLVVG